MNRQELHDATVIYKPKLYTFEREGIHFFVDPEAPNWIATDSRGAKLLESIDGKRTLGDLLRLYTAREASDWGHAWRDVHCFIREGIRRGILATAPITHPLYAGRSRYLQPKALREFWLHLLQTCNLSCMHCLVSSNPQGEGGSDTDFYRRIIDEAADLGARRFYFTGGEPFLRKDIFDLIRYITDEKKAELIVLTNATLFFGERLMAIQTANRERLKFQVSLDGTCAEINDPIRGVGVFQKASYGVEALSGLGFDVSLTAVVTRENLSDLEGLPQLAKGLGAVSVHLLWPHRRGEILKMGALPSVSELVALARKVRAAADLHGIPFDNIQSLIRRINGQPGVKNDLGNFCWESLCLYMDGQVYPSAALAGMPELALGDACHGSLRQLWLESPTARRFREATVIGNPVLASHPFRFLTGGGDMEYSYCFNQEKKSLVEDPYHDLYVELIQDAMVQLAAAKREAWNNKSGFNPPPIYHAMGEDSITCSEDALEWIEGRSDCPAEVEEGDTGILPVSLPEERSDCLDEVESVTSMVVQAKVGVTVRFLHTNCVLSFDVEKPYRAVQQFYGQAAIQPQKELCCPVRYDDAEVGHIPQDVLDRFYGCGSPITLADLRLDETVLDLGSGAGIDCFIAAKKVGPHGKVIGVDMTDPMLEIANQSKAAVAVSLGMDVVEFRKGYLEKIPAEDKSVDLVTSNCVINLSPNKGKVFGEIWRILKDNGRMVVADIVSEAPVPLSLQAHPDLWGECISGALSEEAFIAGLERAGFYGISLLKKTFWKEVGGHSFYSITVRGFKFEKKEGCRFIGQRAIYWGPYKAVLDEEGHLFPRGEAVEICTDTAAKLMAPPYLGQFAVIAASGSTSFDGCCEAGATNDSAESICCAPSASGEGSAPCC